MSIREKAIKIGSTIFMAFIIILIVVAFGMPDFISSSAGAERGLIAQVDDLKVYPADIGRQKQAIQNQFGGENIPPSFAEMIETQAVERAIQEKLLIVMVRDSHLMPRDATRTRELAKFYRENLSSFIKDGKFDIKAFNDVLTAQHRTRVNFDNDAIDQISVNLLFRLLQNINFTSVYDSLENERLNETKLSYKIIALNNADREALIKKQIKVSENEIRARFATEYLSKDPKDKLTAAKREAITAQLTNEKKTPNEQAFTQKLNDTKSLSQVAAITGKRSIDLKDVSLNESLDSRKPKGVTFSLAALEKAKGFIDSVFRVKTGEMFKVSTGDGEYFVEVTARKMAKLPSVTEVKAANGKLDTLISNEAKRNSITKNELSSKYFNSIIEVTMGLMKNSTSIKYFRKVNKG